MLSAFAEGTIHERAIVALGSTMGLRRNEITVLHPRDRSMNTIMVHGKGGQLRTLTLDELTLEILVQLESVQGRESYYFPGRFGGHVHSSTIYKWFKRLLPDHTPHNMRHRAATNGYRQTRDLRAVQEFLGHASVATTEIYTHVTEDDLAEIAISNSLVLANSSRRIAGRSLRIENHANEHQEFIADLARLSANARQYGMSLVVRT